MSEPIVNMDNPFNLPEDDTEEPAIYRALNNVMSTPEGRTVVWHVLGWCKVYNEAFAGNSGDIFEKGQRSIGLRLIATLNEIDPTMYPRMLLDVARREMDEQRLLAEKEKADDRNG